MEAQVSITAGSVTIDYNGSQEFIENGLIDLLKKAVDLAMSNGMPLSLPAPSGSGHSNTGVVVGETPKLQHFSTSTIASKRSVSSGPELIIAAMGHLQLVKGDDTVQRHDIATEMKSATAYYKSTYVSNLTSYLQSLVKAGRINQITDKTYALASSERKSLEQILATE